MFRRRRITVATGALFALIGGYVTVVAVAPLPTLPVSLSVEPETEFVADQAPAQAAADAQARPTAVGWLHDDEVWANDDQPHRIASLTKVITALVGLEAAPVELGTPGPTYTLTWDDSDVLDEIIADGGSFAPVPVGLELTTRQMLELILVPSANNYATSYARWVFGSDVAFLQAANEWLAKHGLDSVRIFDASGMNDDNQATAADMVKISRLALENPLVADIVRQSTINIPELGEISTTNRLLADPTVLGIKTGTTFPEGYSLATAQLQGGVGRDLVAITVVMDREDADARANDASATLGLLAAAQQPVTLVEPGEQVASVITWTGETVGLVAEAGATTVLVPGEAASRQVELGEVSDGPAEQKAGTIRTATPGDSPEISVVTTAAIERPDLWWRITNPATLFGWAPLSAEDSGDAES